MFSFNTLLEAAVAAQGRHAGTGVFLMLPVTDGTSE